VRIVAIGDTHTFQADLGVLPEGDVLLHAGDLLRSGKFAELPTVAAWLRSQPHRHKIVIAGNHDWCFQREREQAVAELGPTITYLEDSEAVIDGVRFWGSPWQPYFFNWAFNLPRGEQLAQKWQLIPEGIDVLITHGPPAGIGDHTFRETREGCADLLDAVRRLRPAVHVFGHIHEDGGAWLHDGTWFVNANTWECQRDPTVFDFDPGSRTVTMVHVPPRLPRSTEAKEQVQIARRRGSSKKSADEQP